MKMYRHLKPDTNKPNGATVLTQGQLRKELHYGACGQSFMVARSCYAASFGRQPIVAACLPVSGLRNQSHSKTKLIVAYSAAGASERIVTSAPHAHGAATASAEVAAFDDPEPIELHKCRHFVNLTNGLEAIPMLHELGLPYSFVRIQSTACEQQNMEALMLELDANLLINLALGHCCLVYDCGSRRRDGTPRALWYGLEFVRYTLTKLWLRRPCPALLRGKNVARSFDDHIRAFKQSTVRRLQYYAKYVPTSPEPNASECNPCPLSDFSPQSSARPAAALQQIRLYGVYCATDHDTDIDHFVSLLHTHQLPSAGPLRQPAVQSTNEMPAGGGWGEGLQYEDAVAGSGGSGPTGRDGGLQHQEITTTMGVVGLMKSGGRDGEAVLEGYGYRCFRRGLSPAEWAAVQRTAAGEAAAVVHAGDSSSSSVSGISGSGKRF